jgi:aryl-alcohol dehydrogenase-like predicted oxidoreductase
MPRPFAPGLPAPSPIGLGTANFAPARADHAYRLLDAYVGLGGTLIDTAARYGFGDSERVIGQWLRTSDARESVILLTKGAHPDPSWTSRLDAASITSDLDQSLENLGVDHVDVLMVHRDDERLPIEPIVDTLQAQVAGDRTRAVGVSNWTPGRLARAMAYAASTGGAPIAASSVYLGLARPTQPLFDGCIDACDDASLTWYAAHDVPLLAWSSQSSGYFEPDWDPATALQPVIDAYDTTGNRARRTRARELGLQIGATANQVAIAWVLAQPCRPVALGGFRDESGLRDAWAAASIELSLEQCHWLETGDTLD